jgi:hypothetical protein
MEAMTYICPASFKDVSPLAPPVEIVELDCDLFQEDGSYTLNTGMEFLGATILHEMTHFNLVGTAGFNGGRYTPDNAGSNVKDIEYGPIPVRKLRKDHPDQCTANADSYVWWKLRGLQFAKRSWIKVPNRNAWSLKRPETPKKNPTVYRNRSWTEFVAPSFEFRHH